MKYPLYHHFDINVEGIYQGNSGIYQDYVSLTEVTAQKDTVDSLYKYILVSFLDPLPTKLPFGIGYCHLDLLRPQPKADRPVAPKAGTAMPKARTVQNTVEWNSIQVMVKHANIYIYYYMLNIYNMHRMIMFRDICLLVWLGECRERAVRGWLCVYRCE